MADRIDGPIADILYLEKVIDRLRKALEFYANEKHMGNSNKRFMRSDCYAIDDGKKAREALK